MSAPLEPLDDELRLLVEDTKACDAANPVFEEPARERVLAKVESSLGSSASRRGGVGFRSGVMLASFCLIGTIAGSQLLTRSDAPASTTVAAVQDVAVATPPPAAPREEAVPTMHVEDLPSSASPPPASPPAGRIRTNASPVRPSARVGSDLAEEYRLVESARAKLAARDPSGALRPIQEYEARFPSGQLVQETESLHIQALVEMGRISEARERAERFRVRFPNGILLPSVVRAITSGP
jgi:hypothetical protein